MKKLFIFLSLFFIFFSCDDEKSNNLLLPIVEADISAKVKITTDFSVDNGTITAVPFDQEVFDTDNIHDETTNTSRLTINTPGLYLIQANAQFAANSSGIRSLQIWLNGSNAIQINNMNACTGASNTTDVQTSFLYYLNKDNYIQLVVYQSSGGDLLLRTPCTFFSVIKM